MKTPPAERAAGRKALAAKGQALPDGETPVPDLAYLRKAIRSVGRLDPSKRPALKALIRKRAKELGALNAPGVKGTWAFEAANDGEAIEMAATPALNRTPRVRGAADVTLRRTGPGAVSVQHKATGTRVGMLHAAPGGGWQARHVTGKTMDVAPSQAASLSSLIGAHNKLAASVPSTAAMPHATAYAGDTPAVDLAVPAVTSGDGPRVTSMGGGSKAASAPVAKPGMARRGMTAEVAKVYKKLLAKGMRPAQAMALAKRAAAMHAKKAKAAA